MKARKYATGGSIGNKPPKKRNIGKVIKRTASSEYEAKRQESRTQYAESADAYKRQMRLNRAASAMQQGDTELSQRIASGFQGRHQTGISSQEVATGARTPEAAARERKRR